MLENIVSISAEKSSIPFCFSISAAKAKWILSASDQEERASWLTCIDSLTSKNFNTLMPPKEKTSMLELLFAKKFKGGTISSQESKEIWHYSNGLLQNKEGMLAIEFAWNGETLTDVSSNGTSGGSGIWNGVWIQWYDETIRRPFMRYFWYPEHSSFYEGKNKTHLTWKWAGKCLTCAFGTDPGWEVAGDVPYVIVMFLQLLRYHRHFKLNETASKE